MIHRGEVWWATLPDPVGAGPGYRRPVLVIQSTDFNRSRIRTVVAVAITSNLALAGAPGNVPLAARITKLPRDSVANVSQVITVDKALLTRRVAALPRPLLDRIDAGLRLVLSL